MNAVVVLCLVACCTLSSSAELVLDKSQSWDFLLLAQFWPGSSCIYFKKDGCHIPPGKDHWSIHGLWPSTDSSKQPEFCNDSLKFDYNQIASLRSQLDEYWPYYNKTGDPTELWAHEWNKHGTCALSLPAISGELKYFSATLNLYRSLNVYEVLANANILPSHEQRYNLTEISRALRTAYGKVPQIECYYNDGKHYLDQLYQCFDKSLQIIDCPEVHRSSFRQLRSNSFQKRRQSLVFKTENIGGSTEGQPGRLGQYFINCPKDDFVYYITEPSKQQFNKMIKVEAFEK